MSWRHAVVFACISGLLIVGLLSGCRKHTSSSWDKYDAATPIPSSVDPQWQGQAWDYTWSLPDGKTATVTAREGPSEVYLQFSDETEPRTVYERIDYLYPVDIRISRDGRVLFVKVSGLGGGVVKEMLLYEYDLAQRRLRR